MKHHYLFQKYIFILILLLSGYFSKATVYYFSTTDGDDSRTSAEAQNPTTPWKSLAKLNAVFSSLRAGDSVLFKRGDVFNGSIRPNVSGSSMQPIVFSAYDKGENPVISGLTRLSGWAQLGSNIWEANFSDASNEPNIMIMDGRMQPIGRYPNANAANGGYLFLERYSGNISITDNELTSSPNWNGGEVVIRKNRWVLDRNKITSHNGNTIYYKSESGYYATNNYGYFIQNHPGTLDQDREWCYNSTTKKVQLYLKSSPAANKIEFSAVNNLVTISNISNIAFSNITFVGANDVAVKVSNAQNITFIGCSILYTGNIAINADNTNGLKVDRCNINYSNNIALNINNCTNTVVIANTIKNTGVIPGMGKGDSGSYEALLISGNNNLVEKNTIDSTGYIPITFQGNSVTIKNNCISNYAMVKDDGGGIYTWNNVANAPVYTNRKNYRQYYSKCDWSRKCYG